ncbi:hypothetical protein MIR68_003446 [Amoeboaphelidium protococcarum]|nr:hypothetical protein MIR68_003446 [Amoeboaphelidium protococcarum]
MKVLENQDALLSNYEVYKILSERQADRKSVGNKKKPGVKQQPNVATIEFETKKYMKDSGVNKLNDGDILHFLEQTRDLKLTKLEKLQILNLRPQSLVDLYIIVEHLESRFNDPESLLETIMNALPQTDNEDAMKE